VEELKKDVREIMSKLNDHDLIIQVATTQRLMADELKLMRVAVTEGIKAKADAERVERIEEEVAEIREQVEGLRKTVWTAAGAVGMAIGLLDLALRFAGK
jgi:uncharacterized protein (UPF0335 family)